MPSKIPDLSLSHGQVLRAIAYGEEPSQRMKDEARYLRILGVPFDEKKQSTGRGNRRLYDFDDLIELAVAFFYLRHGMKPKDLGEYMPKARKGLRELARRAFLEQPETAMQPDWVKSRGKKVPLLANEIFLPYHDRYSETPAKIEFSSDKSDSGKTGKGDITDLIKLLNPTTRLSTGEERAAIPLTRLVLETVAWALEMPELRTGPVKTAQKKA